MGGIKEVFSAYLGPGPEKGVKDPKVVNLEKRRFGGRLALRRQALQLKVLLQRAEPRPAGRSQREAGFCLL